MVLWYIKYSLPSPQIFFLFSILRLVFYIFQLYPLGLVILTLYAFYPVSFFAFEYWLINLNEIASWYLFALGLSYSFDMDKLDWKFKLLYICSAPLLLRYWNLFQCAAVVWSIAAPMKDFDIINKNI